MPDFDTQTPPERRDRPIRLRIGSMANMFRGLLVASKPHILSIVSRLRTLLITSKPRIGNVREAPLGHRTASR
jgi:hypothetical protein